MKAGIYVRLSEEDKDKKNPLDESRSIINQKELLRNYASERGWEIYDIYCDDDYAGADRNRPQFKRLIEDAKAGKIDIILCKTLSRFTREIELVEKYIHGLFPLWGVRFISIVDNADSSDRKNKKARQISGLINEWYLEDMSENIKSVLTDRRRAGKHIGSFALYGYIKDPENRGHLICDPDAAETVKRVFFLYSEGFTMTEIANTLNCEGVPSPKEYKRLKGEKYKSSKKEANVWRYPAISSMLRNEMYIGNMVQGKFASESYKTKKNRPCPKDAWYVVENTHEAIIDKELWDKVQKRLSHSRRAESTGDLR